MFLVYDPATNPLNNNEWSFPLLECIHIAGFTLSIGTIAIVDFCLLGWGTQKPAQLLKETAPWTLFGLVMLLSGPMIFSSDPNMYLHNYSFQSRASVSCGIFVSRRWCIRWS